MLQPEFSLPEFVNGAADTQRGAVLFKGLAAEEIYLLVFQMKKPNNAEEPTG